MGVLGNKIKTDIVMQYDKTYNDQEKIAEIVEIDKGKNTCTINVVGRDGSPGLIYDVQVQKSPEGLVQWSPKAGDLVQVTEKNRRYVITGKHTLNSTSHNNITKDDVIAADMNGLFGGYLAF